MELERASFAFTPPADRRPYMPEPPPVKLVAIEDVRAPAAAGLEVQLDDFYVNLLRFERDTSVNEHEIVYKAENARLCFDTIEPPVQRDDFRPIAIDVQSLSALEQQLIDREIEYQWQRGLMVGRDTLLFQDPAGNCVAITERRGVG